MSSALRTMLMSMASPPHCFRFILVILSLILIITWIMALVKVSHALYWGSPKCLVLHVIQGAVSNWIHWGMWGHVSHNVT